MNLAMEDARRYVLRPARASDLPALERMAFSSAIGITSLPDDREALRRKLEQSAKSFASDNDASGEETYLFVLEDNARDGRIIGTSGIAASAGFHDRFFSYRNEFIVQVSTELGARNRIHTLHLCHDLTGVTLLTGFYIDPEYEHTLAPHLLSRARLLFISQFADRFSDRVAAESPGLADDTGRCPFWDAVGRRFFNMDYSTAGTFTSGRSKAFIAELMPQSPIYVPLLPEEAQWSLGQLHPVAELPFSILIDEGFDADTYINIFDGGPTVEGRLPMLRTVAGASYAHFRRLAAGESTQLAMAHAWNLVANEQFEEFRAMLLPAPSGHGLVLDAEQVRALRLGDAQAEVMQSPLELPEAVYQVAIGAHS